MRRKTAELPSLTAGPLPKSFYTSQLERIARNLMSAEHFEFQFIQNINYIIIDGKAFNWTDTLRYANWEQINLGQEEFDLYAKFLKTHAEELGKADYYPYFNSAVEEKCRDELYQFYDPKKRPDPPISLQEMQAINVYTGSAYFNINVTMRYTEAYQIQESSKEHYRRLLITAVMCASGLRKVPEVPFTDVYRGMEIEQSVLNNYIEAAKKNGIVQLSGFVSTSVNGLRGNFNTAAIEIHFQNLKGVYVAPISQRKTEEEFLIPPTQIQITQYQEKNGRHYFEAQTVSDLASVAPETISTINPNLLTDIHNTPSTATIIDLSFNCLEQIDTQTLTAALKAIPAQINTLSLANNNLGRLSPSKFITILTNIPEHVSTLVIDHSQLNTFTAQKLEAILPNIPEKFKATIKTEIYNVTQKKYQYAIDLLEEYIQELNTPKPVTFSKINQEHMQATLRALIQGKQELEIAHQTLTQQPLNSAMLITYRRTLETCCGNLLNSFNTTHFDKNQEPDTRTVFEKTLNTFIRHVTNGQKGYASRETIEKNAVVTDYFYRQISMKALLSEIKNKNDSNSEAPPISP